MFKKGKKEDPGNYRLLSLPSIPQKVREQLILESICRHMKDKKIIRNSQHGFTKEESCLIILINFCDERTGLVDDGRGVHLDSVRTLTLSPIRSS